MSGYQAALQLLQQACQDAESELDGHNHSADDAVDSGSALSS